VQHRNDNGMNVRVLNLSYGTNGTQSYQLDPLTAAVEHAWKAGIVVVVAGGNSGTNQASLDNPATDPYVISVGADDPTGTAAAYDDTIPSFSSRGSSSRHVDLVAPGQSIVSLRDPGSVIDTEYPSAVVNTRFFKGSGTSQAAAVVSGAGCTELSNSPGQTRLPISRPTRPPSEKGARCWQSGLGVRMRCAGWLTSSSRWAATSSTTSAGSRPRSSLDGEARSRTCRGSSGGSQPPTAARIPRTSSFDGSRGLFWIAASSTASSAIVSWRSGVSPSSLSVRR